MKKHSAIERIKFFPRLVGKRFWITMILSMAAALAEGVGWGLLLPVLQLTNSDGGELTGNAFTKWIEIFDIRYTLGIALTLFASAYALRSLLLIIQGIFVGDVRAILQVRIREKLYRQIFSVQYTQFLRMNSSSTNSAFMIETERIANAVMSLSMVFTAIAFSVMYLIWPLITSPSFTLIAMVIVAPLSIGIRRLNKYTMTGSHEITRTTGRLQDLISQSLQNFKYLKATNVHSIVAPRLNREARKLSHLMKVQSILQAANVNGVTPIILIVLVVLLYVNVEMLNGDLIQSAITLFLLRRAFDSLATAQSYYRRFLSLSGSIDIVRELETNLDSGSQQSANSVGLPDQPAPLHVQDVSFEYEDGVPILRNINLDIEAGERVVVVGPSGSGKSTLALMLTGLIAPTSGMVTNGHVSIGTIDPAAYGNSLGYVTQENVMFRGTIRDNITLWDENISDARFDLATHIAVIDELITGFPMGYDTQVGDFGQKLSGGERQRVAIAREIYRAVDFLILDEATSALDSETEAKLMSRLSELNRAITTIAIAHRVSTIQYADTVVMIENGKVVTSGKFDHAYRSNSRFEKFFDASAHISE
jgi:ABC-type multidrug transport system fused ATPase/permease subunit